jgi:predicted RNA-binding Zn-ribbon protein involved in translation (DUF1610 family)
VSQDAAFLSTVPLFQSGPLILRAALLVFPFLAGVSMSSEQQAETQERACPKCGGDLKWYRSETVPKLGVIEHFFVCANCGHMEKETRPPHSSR